ncbi:hypothetical protein A2J03_22615 [Rhodococcus sp. EPR-157]|uniref:helix-turn-helix domain-containing protein n=1 Tax=Rhodococcus sp. EPR-157 TaxID=1813677 RepID=UPI0007BC2A5C|nr:helix-turn-helix transcriptional regulator [Rhodococcus sp. EPR-157]KZF07841.1 hypothetical protein A2J03_22615 [Rhodococcus sp. EPR-157]
MDIIAALEAELAEDRYGPLREHLAVNDDHLLEQLVKMRKSKHLTQDEVAARMHRSKTAVSNFERLGSDPHLSTIRRYAAAIGGRIVTRLDDFDSEVLDTEVDAIVSVSIKVPKSGNLPETRQSPAGVWETV